MIRLSQNFVQDGPHEVRYCSCTGFFFRLRQHCRYQLLFNLRASKPAFLNLERNYPASGIIEHKFYCLFSLRCCNWLIGYFSVSTTSFRNCNKKRRTLNNNKHSQMHLAWNGADKTQFTWPVVDTLSPSTLVFRRVQKPRHFWHIYQYYNEYNKYIVLSVPVAYPGIFFGWGVQQIQLRTERTGIWGGSSPLFRGSGGSCNLVQVISFHMVKFS